MISVETLREIKNLVLPRNEEGDRLAYGMHLEIIQALDLDGVTRQEWDLYQAQGDSVRHYVNRALYQHSRGEQ